MSADPVVEDSVVVADPVAEETAARAVRRVLVVAAHPDDIDYGAAATIAGWTEAGVDVSYCVVTRGDAGGFDDTPRDRMPALREREQRAAAAALGVTDVEFLGYPDGRVVVSLDLRRDIARRIREVRPDRVVTQSPIRDFLQVANSHPDHMAVAEATLCAVYPDARNPFAFPELAEAGIEAWTVPEVWLMHPPGATTFLDVTDNFPRKLAALRAHVSQTAHLPDLEGILRGWMGRNAANGGLPEGRLAETFTIVDTS